MKKKVLTLSIITSLLLVAICLFGMGHIITKAASNDTTSNKSNTVIVKENTENENTDIDNHNVNDSDEDSEDIDYNKPRKKIRYKIQMSTNYYIPKYTKKGIIHYGVNGWQDVKEQDMDLVSSYQSGTGVFTTYYTYEAIVTVREGDTIDYCFRFITTMDTEGWINNENNNYHVKVWSSNVPCSYTVVYRKPYYEASAIDFVDLCYTLNNWDNVKYSRMTLHTVTNSDGSINSYFDTTIHGYETDTLQYCYRIIKCNGEQEWDNNDGKNYKVSPLYQPE